jgi:uncharacterized protein YbjT (DUF2867 family)
MSPILKPLACPHKSSWCKGDLTSPETLEPALNGVVTLFLMWTAPIAAFPEIQPFLLQRPVP